LMVKQVREIPLPSQTPRIVPFLINDPVNLCVFQGEYGDVFANHRLKSRWMLSARNVSLAQTNVSFYAEAALEYLDGAEIKLLSGLMPSWPGASHVADSSGATDRWTIGVGLTRRDYELVTGNIKRLVSQAESPLQFLGDFEFTVNATYAVPVPIVDWTGPATTTNESVRLRPCPRRSAEDLLQDRQLLATVGGKSIRTSFYWPKEPQGAIAGYTAPLVDWVETRIEGLTAQPILLRGFYSQTYRPEHHNFGEQFVFEPRLEPGLSPAILNELQAANIRLVHLRHDRFGATSKAMILGLDGKFRELK
ncbi:MAG: hypothetical protein HY674_21895, partial [Chloroflexi bacterium]|nr:hypothetical protein [Chloroflexota bacterium]